MTDRKPGKPAAPRKGTPFRKDKAGPARAQSSGPSRAQGAGAQDKPRRFGNPAEARIAEAKPAHAKPSLPRPSKPPLHRKPKPRVAPSAPHDDDDGMRIAKVMARAGLCSRRDAELWIAEGRVALNGKPLTSPAVNVGPEDQISVDGVPVGKRERTRLFLFHKPRGLVTTDKDPEGRRTIFDHLHDNWPSGPRVITIGRLDINTEGLLLLTNDGGLARVLELPATGWMRRYRVRANGKTDQAVLDRLRNGITIEGVDYAGIEATLDRVQGDNVWLTLGLREGKNREIKRVLEHLGLFVNRLIRISFGPFQLGELADGKVEEVRTRVLRDQLGPALAKEADTDFDSPVGETRVEPMIAERPARGGRERDTRGRDARERPSRERPPREAAPHAKGPREKSPRRGTPERGAKGHGSDARRADARPAGRDKKGREAPAPVEPSFKPRGPRKHISAMRAIDTEAGPRKRTVQSETADRKGRTVAVEFKAKVRPARTRDEAPPRDTARPDKAPPRGRQTRPAPGKPSGGRPGGGRPAKSRPEGARADAGRPDAGRPHIGRPSGGRPSGGRPSGDRSGGERSGATRPKAAGNRHAEARPPAAKGPPRKGGRPPQKPTRPQRPR